MSGDHFIPQGYLRKWLAPPSYKRLCAVVKTDAKVTNPRPGDTCRRKNHSTNNYLPAPRIIEDVLRKFEPSLPSDIDAVANRGLDRRVQKRLSMFIAFTRIYTPANIRVEAARFLRESIIQLHSNQIGPVQDRLIEHDPKNNTLHPIKYLRDDGAILFKVSKDIQRKIQATQINRFDSFIESYLNRYWQVIMIDCDACFLTSDNPMASMNSACGRYRGFFVPLSPKFGIWLSELNFAQINKPHVDISPFIIDRVDDVGEINRQIIRYSESVVIYNKATKGVQDLVSENRNFKVQYCINIDDPNFSSEVRAMSCGMDSDGFRAVIVDDDAQVSLGDFSV